MKGIYRINEYRTNYLNNARQHNFKLTESRIDGHSFRKNNFAVIVSIGRELDNKLWLHVSMSFPKRLPDYDDMKYVKDIFIGQDKKAIQVFSEDINHVNVMEYCLHLWHCMDSDPLPDFTRGKGVL